MPPVNGVCSAAGGGASGLPAPPPHGVWGDCRNGPGVYGSSLNDNGVRGQSRGQTGVYGTSDRRIGVYGYGPDRGGVFGYGKRYGVYGIADGQGSDTDPTVYAGLEGRGDFGSYNVGRAIGVYGEGPIAGHFNGSVLVTGTFIVSGGKSPAVPHPDGSLRQLYSLECPESWFEDFGRAVVSEGHSRVELDGDFAALVATDDYHVFVTPEGDSNGLYVSARTAREFEVREQGAARALCHSAIAS